MRLRRQHDPMGETTESLSWGDRALRAWGFACALLFGANLLALWVLEPGRQAGAPELKPYINEGLEAAYPGMTEAQRRQLLRESSAPSSIEALAQPREAERRGEYVNVAAAGFRWVAEQGPWPPVASHYNVFFFGGSTGFGYRVADADTVASHLQTMLGDRDGRPTRVYNFAHGGFNSHQERLAFDRLLSLGHVPDLAVFLDGMNEFVARGHPLVVSRAATASAEDKIHNPLWSAFKELPLMQVILPRFSDAPPEMPSWNRKPQSPAAERREFDKPERSRRILDSYRANADVTRALGDAYGVDSLFVWQPTPTYRYDLAYHAYPKHFGGHTYSRYGYPRMARRVRAGQVGPDFVWCADLQHELREPLYIDAMHYNPKLSRLVAGCIADGIVHGQRPRPHAPGR